MTNETAEILAESAMNCANGNCGKYQTSHLSSCEFFNEPEQIEVVELPGDEWSRPRLKAVKTGEIYADINCGYAKPDWHSTTVEGEPIRSVMGELAFIVLTPEQVKRQTRIDDARKMLDWLEANPDIKIHDLTYFNYFFSWSDSSEDVRKMLKPLGLGDSHTISESSLEITKEFGTARFRVNLPLSAIGEKITVAKEVEEWRIDPAFLPEVSI